LGAKQPVARGGECTVCSYKRKGRKVAMRTSLVVTERLLGRLKRIRIREIVLTNL